MHLRWSTRHRSGVTSGGVGLMYGRLNPFMSRHQTPQGYNTECVRVCVCVKCVWGEGLPWGVGSEEMRCIRCLLLQYQWLIACIFITLYLTFSGNYILSEESSIPIYSFWQNHHLITKWTLYAHMQIPPVFSIIQQRKSHFPITFFLSKCHVDFSWKNTKHKLILILSLL